MIVKIKKSEVDALKYACAVSDLKVEFYSNEAHPELVAAQIDAAWMSEEVAFYLARMFEAKVDQDKISI